MLYQVGMSLLNSRKFRASSSEADAGIDRNQVRAKPDGDAARLLRIAVKIFDAAGSAIVLLDRGGEQFESIHGGERGRRAEIVALCQRAIGSGEKAVVRERAEAEGACLQPGSEESGHRLLSTAAPLFDCADKCVGALCVFGHPEIPPSTELSCWQDLQALARSSIRNRPGATLDRIVREFASVTSDAILAADHAGRILFCNPAAERMFGQSATDIVGRQFSALFPDCPSRSDRWGAFEPSASNDGFVEREALHADGSRFPTELSFASIGEADERIGFASIIRDISVRKRLEAEKRHAVTLLDTIVKNLPAMLFVKDVATREYVFVNPAAERLIGRPAKDIIGRTDRELFPDQGADYEARDTQAIALAAPFTFEGQFVRDDGETANVRTKRVIMDSADGESRYILGLSEDVSETRRVEAKVLQLARYDALTGLYNRSHLTEIMHDLVNARAPFTLLSIDLDRFKAINDQFGHLVGDRVLKMVGERLQAIVGSDNHIARIGGDEFAAIIEGADCEAQAIELAQRAIDDLARPFEVDNRNCYIGTSIGMVGFPHDGKTTDELRGNADLALYRAKADGRGTYCVFDSRMDAVLKDQRELETELREAIANGEISLEFQPVYSVEDWSIVSAEALARWNHPTRGPISPETFIPLAEECGLIGELEAQVLQQACEAALQWPSHICVAVNLSPLQFHSGSLPSRVIDTLESTGFPPERLQMEVTESLLIQDVDRTFEQLEALRAHGIQVLLDDFGVGYSSLSYFQRFTFDRVKIDRSFVNEIDRSHTAKAIVEAIVRLGRKLQMGVVAEGVETEEQMHVLSAMGCTHLQGYFLSRPVNSKLMSRASLQNVA